ncbi:uncharacterized protein J7T54_004061 [Emericellopsis cladophorae]|uniref:Autophagy-related protein 28 n=1 Tax=Emericellopsis cladophorae TaxID=2686198 RepID=A0A9P9Y0F4_9HYPO|nr:uncharacterized protein J7T54_004061 [Emericellopsis cladophorae]KAI6781288.1 hypothetical protein J7T54_004061 [Emericellopsis cladophorae]
MRTSRAHDHRKSPSNVRSSSAYSMEELEPWPEDDHRHVFIDRPNSHQSSTSDAWRDEGQYFGSPPEGKRKTLFSGPPPPITSTILPPKTQSRSLDPSERPRNTGLGSLIWDYNQPQGEAPSYKTDSTWRTIRRHERGLQREIQDLLDAQGNGLVASGEDEYSDAGDSTPTGTFYSSNSRLANTLYIPPQSTAEGDVIPVRQPKPSTPRGLRAARTGLRRSISVFAKLKAEENQHVEDALAERRKALSQLHRLSLRKDSVETELKTLEDDEQEPLGKELRELGERYESITSDIRELEEKLIGMRNQRRWLREKMEDVRNRRDAGLSGYRGALKDVDSEVARIMRHPPFQPLDSDALGKAPSTGGQEFIRMIPERRTVDMAKGWWEQEIAALDKRKTLVENEQRALQEGGIVWNDVMRLVADYEARFRAVVKGEQSVSTKGKEKQVSQEEMLRAQLPEMDKVMKELKRHHELAEDKSWTLLICAIGAELEALQQGQEMLRELLDVSLVDRTSSHDSDHDDQKAHADQQDSDNEVPADLMLSKVDSRPSQASAGSIDNDVPPDLMAEHQQEPREKLD